MRTKLLSVVLTISIVSCNQKPPAAEIPKAVNDWANENLKGSPTQVEADTYKIDSAGKTGPLDEKNIEKYDSSGYTTSVVTMNGKDSIKTQMNFAHEANGYMTSMETTGAKNEKKSSLTIQYDGPGKYAGAKSYDSTGKMDVYYIDLTANSFGQVTGGKGYHPDSTLKMSFVNEFDSVYYVGGSSKDSLSKTTYNGKQTLNDKKDMVKLEEMTVTTDPKTKKDSTKTTITTFTYDGWDSHGNWTQQTSINEKGKPTKIIKRMIVYKD
ncbi:MAG TPA: hypothetical protein VFI33_14490 [Puia sp.]|nr:hypothetical protein [Puia sp.]